MRGLHGWTNGTNLKLNNQPIQTMTIEKLSTVELWLALDKLNSVAYASLSYEEKALLIDVANELEHRRKI